MSEEKITNEAYILQSLFEPTNEPENNMTKEKEFHIPEPTVISGNQEQEDNIIPVPGTEESNEDVIVTPETILDALSMTTEEGYTDAVIVADLSRLHNVTNEMTYDEISEEDHEYVDQISIEGVHFDLYTMDGHLYNMILRFDSPKDAYMKDLNEMLNRYRAMQENIAENNEEETIAMFSLTLMPNDLNGLGALYAAFPISFFRTLDDNGIYASFLLQFYNENLEFMKLDIDADTRAEVTADVMRETEEGTNGSLFTNEEEYMDE